MYSSVILMKMKMKVFFMCFLDKRLHVETPEITVLLELEYKKRRNATKQGFQRINQVLI